MAGRAAAPGSREPGLRRLVYLARAAPSDVSRGDVFRPERETCGAAGRFCYLNRIYFVSALNFSVMHLSLDAVIAARRSVGPVRAVATLVKHSWSRR